jgi:demethylspheroidene O-methyltransferase
MIGVPWRDPWIAARNRLLSSPVFQRWAADFPLTRGVARRRAQGLFDLVAGFVYSQTLSACVRLGLLDILAQGPQRTEDLAAILSLPIDSAERLLGAAAGLELVERAGHGRYALGPQGAAFRGNAGLGLMIEHHQHLYADLADSVGLLRGKGAAPLAGTTGEGGLAAYWPYATSDTPGATGVREVGPYSVLMAATQPTVAADILKAYPVHRHRRLLDIGGGEGAFLTAAGAYAPRLKLSLFDLPAVTVRARDRLERAGLMDRAELFAGDFLADPLPVGADLMTLIRILHDHSDEGVLKLLTAVRKALPADGALLIAEPMSGAPNPDRISDVYFAFYLLAMGRGRARTPTELFEFLRQAGFRRMRRLRTRTPFLLRAILARP